MKYLSVNITTIDLPDQAEVQTDDLERAMSEAPTFNPPVVMQVEGKLEVLTGRRRILAAQRLGRKQIEVQMFEQDELNPVAASRITLDDNRLHRPPSAVLIAEGLAELWLRMNCINLLQAMNEPAAKRLTVNIGLAGWQAAYQQLLKQAEGQGIPTGPPTTTGWGEFEDFTGISRTQRLRYWRLLRLDTATRQQISTSGIGPEYELAMADCPPERAAELLTAMLELGVGNLSLVVVEAAAQLLYGEGAGYTAQAVLVTASITCAGLISRQRVTGGAVKAATLKRLKQPPRQQGEVASRQIAARLATWINLTMTKGATRPLCGWTLPPAGS